MTAEFSHLIFVGVEGSAKSAVMSLMGNLEGSAVIPVHDKIAFGAGGDECVLKDIREVRKYLAKTNYAGIELLVESGVLQAFLGTSDSSAVDIPFVFDFCLFEKRWKERLSLVYPVSNYDLITIIYQELWQCLTGDKEPTRFVYMSTSRADDAIRFAASCEGSKLIFVNRKFASCAWVKFNRALTHVEKRRSNRIITFIRLVVFCYRVVRFRRRMMSFAKLKPELVHVVNFEEIQKDTPVHLKRIYDFVDSKVTHHVVHEPTYLGTTLRNTEGSYMSSDVARGELGAWMQLTFGSVVTRVMKRVGIL